MQYIIPTEKSHFDFATVSRLRTFISMYLAYKAYKKHQKKKQEASTANGGYERRLSDASKVTEVSMDSHPSTTGGAPPAFSWKETTPGSTKRQWIMLGITLLVDVVLPIMLYVSWNIH